MNLPICEFHQGDWLIPYDSDTPDQIYSVSFQEEMAGIWPIIQFHNNRNVWTYPSYCRQIELNENFFQNNGFDYSPFSSGSYDYKDEDGNKLSFTKIDGNNYWNCYFNDLLIPGKIEYVDDVQRMFRTFKIKKKFVL